MDAPTPWDSLELQHRWLQSRSPWAPSRRLRRVMRRSLAGLASSAAQLVAAAARATMVVSATWASPPRVYAIAFQASSPMASLAALTLAFCGIVIE